MKFSITNGFFIPGPSLASEKQGPRLKFSSENEHFKARMKISSENEDFVRGGMVFCMRSSENGFFRSLGPGPSGTLSLDDRVCDSMGCLRCPGLICHRIDVHNCSAASSFATCLQRDQDMLWVHASWKVTRIKLHFFPRRI